MLSEAERHQLLVEWNQTQADYPRHKCIHQLFEEQVEGTPNTVAVVLGDQQLTYQQLNERTNQLAHYLQKQGVGPETLVGICVERDFSMVVGLLGILKAGGAYVPLDLTYPAERLAFMLTNTQVSILLTQAALLDRLPKHQAHVVCLDTNWEIIAQENRKNPQTDVSPENSAYVLYTSGSTGRPKGVVMQQDSLVNLIQWQLSNTSIPHPKTVQFSPISFDVSFQEIFSTWCAGGTLLLISDTRRREPQALLEFLRQNQIQRLFLPFVALQQLAEFAPTQPLPTSLREVITAGEQLQITPVIASLFERLPQCRLSNQYGPTESHVVTAYDLPQSTCDWVALPPIGKPIANAQIYILDPSQQPTPVGVAGELFIGGVQVARGYFNRPQLTEQKFIENPFGEGRLYKTGDLARYLPNGNIEFLGRMDNQVKIRGFRIELGEIEAVLNSHPAVEQSATTVQKYEKDKRLVAYFVPRQEVEVNTLREYLADKLPDYMLPSAFVQLPQMPLTPNGKIDRRALPAPDMRSLASAEFVPPRNETENGLAVIWQEVLNIEKVGIHDNFLELGGHSLLATQVVSRIREAFLVDIPLRRFFEAPTVAGLGQCIEKIKLTQDLQRPVDVDITPRKELVL